MRNRVAVRFAVAGDLRFISHHDSLRMFERALVRAGIPMRYSAGFNPRPKMRLALPRPVGVASQDELLVVELTEEMQPSVLVASLAGHMPEGLVLHGGDQLSDDEQPRPQEAQYELTIEPNEAAVFAKRANDFIASGRVEVVRAAPGKHRAKSVDIRSFVTSMCVENDRLSWTQTVGQDGTARIGEILEALGLPDRASLARVTRRSVVYQR